VWPGFSDRANCPVAPSGQPAAAAFDLRGDRYQADGAPLILLGAGAGCGICRESA
jgi:hypothetical protein